LISVQYVYIICAFVHFLLLAKFEDIWVHLLGKKEIGGKWCEWE